MMENSKVIKAEKYGSIIKFAGNSLKKKIVYYFPIGSMVGNFNVTQDEITPEYGSLLLVPHPLRGALSLCPPEPLQVIQ
jgi:hypothetical protein